MAVSEDLNQPIWLPGPHVPTQEHAQVDLRVRLGQMILATSLVPKWPLIPKRLATALAGVRWEQAISSTGAPSADRS